MSETHDWLHWTFTSWSLVTTQIFCSVSLRLQFEIGQCTSCQFPSSVLFFCLGKMGNALALFNCVVPSHNLDQPKMGNTSAHLLEHWLLQAREWWSKFNVICLAVFSLWSRTCWLHSSLLQTIEFAIYENLPHQQTKKCVSSPSFQNVASISWKLGNEKQKEATWWQQWVQQKITFNGGMIHHNDRSLSGEFQTTQWSRTELKW